MLTAPQSDRLDHIFQYHAPKPGQKEIYEKVRDGGKVFAQLVTELCPPCGDTERAVNFIRQAVFNANAAIALGGTE